MSCSRKQQSYCVPESYKEIELFYVVCRPNIFFYLSVSRSKLFLNKSMQFAHKNTTLEPVHDEDFDIYCICTGFR